MSPEAEDGTEPDVAKRARTGGHPLARRARGGAGERDRCGWRADRAREPAVGAVAAGGRVCARPPHPELPPALQRRRADIARGVPRQGRRPDALPHAVLGGLPADDRRVPADAARRPGGRPRRRRGVPGGERRRLARLPGAAPRIRQADARDLPDGHRQPRAAARAVAVSRHRLPPRAPGASAGDGLVDREAAHVRRRAHRRALHHRPHGSRARDHARHAGPRREPGAEPEVAPERHRAAESQAPAGRLDGPAGAREPLAHRRPADPAAATVTGEPPAPAPLTIRPTRAEDWPSVWPFVRRIVAAGETFPWRLDLSEAEARARWLLEPPARSFVAVDEAG